MPFPTSSSIRSWLLLALLGSDVIGSPVARDASRFRQQSDGPQHVLGAAVSETAATVAPVSRQLNGKFLHITDFHPDEFYKVHSSTAETSACHRGKGVAGTYGAETSDCDAPYSLINATFDWIAQHVRDDIDFVIWTGDSARHDSDERLPRSAAQVAGSNRFLADKFVSLLDDPKGRGLAVPVVPTLGNNDILPHNVLSPGPNKWLKQYAEIWQRFIPEEQRHAFEFGGWFYVEVIPNQLAVFSLNTLYFFDRNAAVDDCVSPSEPGYKQLEWLRVQLQFLRERGVKAILMGHVPPARTGSKQLWDETCWQKYTLWLRQYRDVVVGSFYGHMNIDHFMVQDTDEINYDLLGVVDEEDEEDGDKDEGVDGGGGDGVVEEAEQPGSVRATMEDEMLTRSAVDYLQELRNGWSKLPNPSSLGEADADKKKGRKGRGPELSRKWNERYQVTLVSPSMVPSYLPTLRIVEYNISGLEDVPVWTEGAGHVPVLPDDGKLYEAEGKKGKKGKKGRKGRKDRDRDGKKDPNLTVPKGPAKTAAIGPAYSVQPLSLLGYTQYYANLTQINNDIVAAARQADETVEASRWRKGKHSDKDPRTKPAKPHKFKFEVEYSTFKDKVYGLSDLTVGSFIETAYRMGGKAGRKAGEKTDEKVDDKADDKAEEVEQQGKKAQNKVWLRFLRHAFVTTVERDELERLGT